MHDFELGHVSLADKFFQLRDPGIGARLVGSLQIKCWVSRADVRKHLALRYRPALGYFDHFAVIAKTDSLFLGQRPEKAVYGLVDFLAIYAFTLLRVSGRDGLLAKVGDVCCRRPDVALRTHLRIREKAVEQSEAKCERRRIG